MEFLEVPIFDDDIFKLMVRLAFNLLFVGLIVFVSYYPRNRNQNYVFSFFLMNIMVFFICFTLKKLDLELGMALGLFAIFSILRFRTDQIRVKDMTYMFIVIGIAVVNSLSNKQTSYAELAFANSVIVATSLVFENHFFREKKTRNYNVVYDNLELLAPHRYADLVIDIEKRLGLAPVRIKIQKVDLKSGTGNIVVYYEPGHRKSTSTNDDTQAAD